MTQKNVKEFVYCEIRSEVTVFAEWGMRGKKEKQVIRSRIISVQLWINVLIFKLKIVICHGHYLH